MAWQTRLSALVAAAALTTSISAREAYGQKAPDKFETVRAYIEAWLSESAGHSLTISSEDLKGVLLDDWANQSGKYEIVSLRKPADYDTAGHIPNAINVYWVDILTDENLARLDPHKTQILYCYYGNASMLSSTILRLLGYKCYSLDFGMMDWNTDALVKEQWDMKADYEVETAVHSVTQSYPAPAMSGDETDARSIVNEAARRYLASEGSPIIRSSSVKDIVDNWDQKKTEYQIVDVRSKESYEAGHVPNAINIPWAEIAEVENSRRLDPHRTVITCSDNGQVGQLATTAVNLLGYHAVNMLFGMMDWNVAYADSLVRWDGTAAYPVEK